MTRWLTLLTLILAGEMVFGLPFELARFFRPTMLEVYGLTNAQLGDLFAAYGVLAMLSYFPGGLLADRYPARTLLSASLVATGAGGIVLVVLPGLQTLLWLYAFWGVSTVLLFWGALIRATREWGGADQQGMAFGFLDAGRGVVAALAATAAVQVFSLSLADLELTAANREMAYERVVMLYVVMTLVVAVMARMLIPLYRQAYEVSAPPMALIREAIGKPGVAAQAGIIIAAYCGYKGLDNYSLYLVQVLDYSEVDAAAWAAWGAFLRPAGALAAGLLADRIRPSRVSLLLFAMMLAAFLALSVLSADVTVIVLVANLAVSYLAVCGMRGIYFALIEEQAIPHHLTGTVVGIVSVVGFTPDIFFAPIAGRILDASPGLAGHQHYFMFLAATAALGLAMTLWLMQVMRRAE